MLAVDIAALARASAEFHPSDDSTEEAPSSRALVLRVPDGRVAAICDVDDGGAMVRVPDLGAFELRDGRLRAFVQADDERAHSALDRIARPLLCQAAGAEVLHASAVRFSAGVVAFCGDAGAGKSTLAHVLAARGHAIWADDAVVLVRAEGTFSSIALPFRPRPGPEVGRRWPATASPPPPGTSAPLAAVVCLSHDEASAAPALARLPPAAAFRSVLPHAYAHGLGDPVRNAALFDAYVDLAASSPTWHLRFRHELDALPALAALVEGAV